MLLQMMRVTTLPPMTAAGGAGTLPLAPPLPSPFLLALLLGSCGGTGAATGARFLLPLLAGAVAAWPRGPATVDRSLLRVLEGWKPDWSPINDTSLLPVLLILLTGWGRLDETSLLILPSLLPVMAGLDCSRALVLGLVCTGLSCERCSCRVSASWPDV